MKTCSVCHDRVPQDEGSVNEQGKFVCLPCAEEAGEQADASVCPECGESSEAFEKEGTCPDCGFEADAQDVEDSEIS